MSTESQIDSDNTSRPLPDHANRARALAAAAAAEREAAELRAATETRTDAQARAALDTVPRSAKQLAHDAESARHELARTLDEIERRLNPATQAKRLVHNTKQRLRILRDEHPEYLAAGALGVSAIATGLIWLGARSFRR